MYQTASVKQKQIDISSRGKSQASRGYDSDGSRQHDNIHPRTVCWLQEMFRATSSRGFHEEVTGRMTSADHTATAMQDRASQPPSQTAMQPASAASSGEHPDDEQSAGGR